MGESRAERYGRNVSDRAYHALRSFYDLFDRRDIDALRAAFRSDAVLRDHRHMSSWGGTPEDWSAMVEGWWSLLPDGRVLRVEPVRVSRTRNVHAVTTGGTDSITGGQAEFSFYVVVELDDDGLIASCDFFDDEAGALEHFERSASAT